jgi:hypothetical protein
MLRRIDEAEKGQLIALLCFERFSSFSFIELSESICCKRSQVQGSTFRVRDKDKIEDPKSS